MGGSTHCGFIVTTRTFHPEKHLLTGVNTVVGENNLQNLTYSYDNFNNLEARIDNTRGMNETFLYDNLNRLTDISLNGEPTGRMTYDNYGRMKSKTMDGQLVFQGATFDPTAKPHAIRSAQTSEGVFPDVLQKIDYTSFDKAKTITEGENRLTYTYGYNRQRIGMEETVGGRQRSKVYVGNCEYITETAEGVTTEKVLTYLSGPTGVFAVVEKQNGEETTHYILKDHLGSWTTVTDAEGNIEQELSFDAWGNLRDPETWTGTSTEAPMFDRGYTGHEHITAFGLINMNGRCYDPTMSSFLSVDEYVQDPTSAQNFNRYSYCLNNPLKYTDPSGWFYLGGSHSSASAQNAGRLALNAALYERQAELKSPGTHVNRPAWYTEGELTVSGGGISQSSQADVSVNSCYYRDESGTIKHVIGINSPEELANYGFKGKYLGITYTDLENQIYYSLLGYAIDMTQCDGKAGDIARKIDLAFLAYEKDKLGNPNKDPLDVYVENPTTISIDEIEFNPSGTNIHAFSYDGNPLYIHVFDGSSGKKCNSMNVAFCGLSTALYPNKNSNYSLSGSTSFIPGYNLYFNNPDANPRDWRMMMVLPTKEKRDLFFEKYNRTFGYW